jgi:N-acetylmuramoyl-L-alanine amidase
MSTPQVTAREATREAQLRILSACVNSPSTFLPIVSRLLNGKGSLSAGVRVVLGALKPDDPDRLPGANKALLARLEGCPGWPDEIVPFEADPAKWLAETSLNGIGEKPETIEAQCRIVLREQRRLTARAALWAALGRIDEHPDELPATLETIKADSERILGEETPGLTERLLESARTVPEMLENPVPVPVSLIGEGLLRAGQICLLHGPDGSRKSWAALHAAVALATGQPWFGIPTRPGGCRVGFVSLEDDEPIWLDRVQKILALTGMEPDATGDRLVVIVAPHFLEALNLTTPEGQKALASFVEAHRLDTLILDHLSRLHELPNEFDLRPVTTPLLRLARTAALGVIVLHHDRKPQGGGGRGSSDASQTSARGDSRLTADCRLLISMKEAGPRLRFAVEKSTTARTPAPIWLAHDEVTGALVVVPGPQSASEAKTENKERMLRLIRDAGPAGASPGAIGAALSEAGTAVSSRTVSSYAKELEGLGLISRTGEGRKVRFHAPEETRKVETPSGYLPGSMQQEAF